MKKKSLVCGLVPALALGMCSTGFAAPASEADLKAIEELRAQLEADLQQAAEMEERLNAQLDSLDKRVTKVEKEAENPRIEMHGYARLRHEKHNFEHFDAIDKNTIRLNLFADYKIADGWVVKSESEFEDNLTHNSGAYEADAGYNWKYGGKQYSREMKQLYINGRIGAFDVKIGRYHLDSPYKLTFDGEVDGAQLKYGIPTKYGKANLTLNAGNTSGATFYGTKYGNIDEPGGSPWAGENGTKNLKTWSLMAEVPVSNATNIVANYGKTSHRKNNDATRNTFSIGFDTKITSDLKFTVATAKSNADILNRSNLLKLQYKEVDTEKPGTYSIFFKKYLLRGHTSLGDKWFMDDLATPTSINIANQLNDENPDESPWDYRAGEFNGFCIGAEFVPLKNTKLSLDYTFGDLGLFNPEKVKVTGEKQGYSFLSAKMEFYF